uniref:HTA909 n=1 Tax=Arundo donax TaxID=35708 RepID=A0A0A9E4X3_ARUDO
MVRHGDRNEIGSMRMGGGNGDEKGDRSGITSAARYSRTAER